MSEVVKVKSNSNVEAPIPLFRELGEGERFPIEELGEELCEAAQVIQESVQAPLALIGQSILSAVALAVQPFANVTIDGREYPISLNAISIGASGERKSAVDSIVLGPHREVEKENITKYERDHAAFKIKDEAYNSTKSNIKNMHRKDATTTTLLKKLNDLGKPPHPPISKIITMEEPTYEGMVKYLEYGRPSIGLFSDEGARMVAGHGMNSDNQLKTVSGLCGLWDGKPISRVRVEGGSMKMYGKRLSLHLMVQPRVSSLLLNNDMIGDQGFLSRCLIVYPNSTVGLRPYKVTNIMEDSAILSYNYVIKDILGTKLPLKEDTNELSPRSLPLSDDAKTMWVSFHDDVEFKLNAWCKYENIRDFGSKAAEHSLRIAGALTLFGNLKAEEINQDNMLRGIQLTQYYLSERLRLNEGMSYDRELMLAKKLLKWCQLYEAVYVVQIYQRGPNEFRSKARALKTIKVLEGHGWLKKVPGRVIDDKYRKDVWEAQRG